MTDSSVIPKKQLHDGFTLPAFGVGMWNTSAVPVDDNPQDPVQLKVMESALSEGVNFFVSSGIDSDLRVGAARRKHPDKEVFIGAHIPLEYNRYNDVLNSIVYTLKRLRVPKIDLAIFEFVSERLPVEVAAQAIDKCKDKNRIGNIGLMNASPQLISEFTYHSKHRIEANVIRMNIARQAAQKDGMMQLSLETGMMLVSHHPIDRRVEEVAEHDVIKELAEKYNCTPLQLALAWLNYHQNVVVLTSMDRNQELRHDLEALELSLLADDVERLKWTFGK